MEQSDFAHRLHQRIRGSGAYRQLFKCKTLQQQVAMFMQRGVFHTKLSSAIKVAGKTDSSVEAEFIKCLQALNFSTKRHRPASMKDSGKSSALRLEGNAFFEKELLVDALRTYNEAAKFCSWDDELFPILLANRSACLYRQREYAACLKEIDAARESGYPADKLSKLLSRKVQCEQKLTGQLARVRTGERTELSLSTFCDMVDDPVKVHRVVLREQVSAGQTLLVERPFAAVAVAAYYQRVCDFCLAPMRAPCPDYYCERCIHARYCSAKCAQIAAVSFHKFECGFYEELMAQNHAASLAFRILCTGRASVLHFLVNAGPDFDVDNAVFPDATYNNISRLMTGLDSRSDNIFSYCYKGLFLTHMLLRSGFFALPTADPTKPAMVVSKDQYVAVATLLAKHMMQVDVNAREVSEFKFKFAPPLFGREAMGSPEESLEEARAHAGMNHFGSTHIGWGLYKELSLVNHSCVQTAWLLFEGSTVLLKAEPGLAQGDEVFISYGIKAAFRNYLERRQALRERYGFACDCRFCDNPTLEAKWHGYRCAQSNCTGLVYPMYDAHRRVLVEPLQWTCLACQHLSDHDTEYLHKLKSLSNALDKACAHKDPARLLQAGLDTLHNASAVLPDESICLANVCDRLATRFIHVNRRAEAVELLTRRLHIFEKVLGPCNYETAYEMEKFMRTLYTFGPNFRKDYLLLKDKLKPILALYEFA